MSGLEGFAGERTNPWLATDGADKSSISSCFKRTDDGKRNARCELALRYYDSKRQAKKVVLLSGIRKLSKYPDKNFTYAEISHSASPSQIFFGVGLTAIPPAKSNFSETLLDKSSCNSVLALPCIYIIFRREM